MLELNLILKMVVAKFSCIKPCYGISGQIFGLISSFLSNSWLQVVLDGKSSQEYPVNAGAPQELILGPTLFVLYIKGYLR